MFSQAFTDPFQVLQYAANAIICEHTTPVCSTHREPWNSAKPGMQAGRVVDSMSELEKKSFFSENIEACLDSLYGLALHLTQNHADAEDLVADSVTKAWAAIDSLDDIQRFRPWVFRILHNGFVSAYRKKSIRPKEFSYDENPADDEEDDITSLLIRQPNDFLAWWGSPEKEFANQLLGEHIMQAIEMLPEAFRVTVMLVNVEGLSYDEAAEVLDVPPGTVRSRMKRGRTLLQKALWLQAKEAGLIAEDAE